MEDMYEGRNVHGDARILEKIEAMRTAGIDAHIQDKTTRLVIDNFYEVLETTRTLAVNTVPGAYTIELTDVTGLVVGNKMRLSQGGTDPASYTADIISISLNTLTMDTPLDVIFNIALVPTIFKVNCQMNVNGAVTPAIFKFTNESDTDLNITRVIFTIVTTGATGYTDFGDIPLLTRGVVLRKKNADGTYFNIANIKSNGQWKAIMYDVDFFDPTHPAAVNGVAGRLTFAGQNKIGVVIRITNTEDLELVIQDNLSTLVAFIMVGEGHYVDHT